MIDTHAVTRAAPLDLIEEIRTRYEPRIARAFLDAIEKIKGEVDWAAIEELIRAGRTFDALEIIVAQVEAAGAPGLSSEYRNALIAAGDAAALSLIEALTRGVTLPAMPGLAPTNIDFAFDVTPNAVTQAIQEQRMTRIREISTTTRQAIEQAIQVGVQDGRNPLDMARDFRGSIGLTSRQERAVQNYRRALEEGDRAALDRALRDRRFDRVTERLINEGKPLPPDRIRKMVQRYRERYIKHRSETIARTETARAISLGQHRAWMQAVQEGLVRADQMQRKWIYTRDGRTRHAHVTIPTMNPENGVGLMEPFKSEFGPIMFPGDPGARPENTINCRCAVLIEIKPESV